MRVRLPLWAATFRFVNMVREWRFVRFQITSEPRGYTGVFVSNNDAAGKGIIRISRAVRTVISADNDSIRRQRWQLADRSWRIIEIDMSKHHFGGHRCAFAKVPLRNGEVTICDGVPGFEGHELWTGGCTPRLIQLKGIASSIAL